MKTKSWRQIDAQFMRLQKVLDAAIIIATPEDIELVASKRWDILFNAWKKAHDNIAKLQNAKFRYLIPDEDRQYTRKEYMGY